MRRSRQPPTFLFAVAVRDSLAPCFVGAQSPAAAAQLGVGPSAPLHTARMDKPSHKAYSAGERTAREAISRGVPRLVVTQGLDEEMIDSRTGLPVAGLSAPPELAAWQADYVRGFNEEMLRAVGSGQVTTDFRPLLMTREQIHEAFRDHTLGTLSPDCPRLEDAGGRFILKLDVPKPRKASKTGLPRPARPPSGTNLPSRRRTGQATPGPVRSQLTLRSAKTDGWS